MKYVIAAVFLAVSIHSSGQFNKGDKVLGGTISLSSSKSENLEFGYEDLNSTFFGIHPSFGLLLNKNLEFGIRLGHTFSRTDWRNGDATYDRKLYQRNGALYMQRYFVISDKFLFSLITDINYGNGNEKIKSISQNQIVEQAINNHSIGITLKPNFIFFPSRLWGLQASIGEIGYAHLKNKTSDETTKTFAINYGNISFGIAYYFRHNVE